jgi:hypothetical protein
MFEHFHNKKASEIWNYFIEITSQTPDIPSDSSDSDYSDDSDDSDGSYVSSKTDKSEQPPVVIRADPTEEEIINVCEKYLNSLNSLKENRNSKTIEIYKLQCEALNIDQ